MILHNESERMQELKCGGRDRENLQGCHFISTEKEEKEWIHKKVCQGKDLRGITALKELK